MPTTAAQWTHTHPYLSGMYAPLSTEQTCENLQVIGELPKDLAGTYVRNSSNPRFPPLGRYHWFDGDGMLQATHVGEGQATFRNRWVQTKAFQAETEAGKALWSGVTERPDFTNPRGPFKDSANTDVVYHAGRLLALWWLGGEPYIVRMPDLKTCGTLQLGGGVKTLSAHPKVDAVTGELRFFDYKPYPPYLSYGVLAKDGTLRHFTHVDLAGPRLQHDMAITENYSLLFDMSLMWDPALLKEGKTRVRFFRDRASRIGVLPRYGNGDQIRWFECGAFYMYHTINAWEEGDQIILIGCRIEDPLVDDASNKQLSEPVPSIGFLRLAPYLWKWTLDLRTGLVKEEQLGDTFIEFPRMDNRVLGRKSRYSYNPRIARVDTINFDGVIKHDAQTGASKQYLYPQGFYGGETTFAPRIGSSAEDDGYVVSYVAEAATGAGELYILDAQNIEHGPVARVQIPGRLPVGYHTWWVPDSELAQQQTA